MQLMAPWQVELHFDGTATIVQLPEPEPDPGNGEPAG